MKKIVSNALYILFFGFALTLVTACIMLMINISKGNERTVDQIEAVQISAAAQDDAKYEPIRREIADSTDYSFAVVRSGYNALENDEKKHLYDSLLESIYSVTNEADENGRYRISRINVDGKKLSEFDIREVVSAFINDNPEYFWIENLFGYAYVGDNTIVEFYSVLSADECGRYIENFNKRVKEILSGVKKGMGEYQREKAIHDAVLDVCEYKSGVKTSADGWQYFTAYGALCEGEAVCEGYAKSMQLLLSRVGISCGMIRGEADGIPHLWNVVQLGGEWYHLDPTWDDSNSEGRISYEYFNLTTEDISKNHVISENISTIIETENSEEIDSAAKYNFFVPMCTKKNMNYYYAEGIYIQTLDSKTEKAIIDALVERAKNKEIYFPVRFGNEMSYSDYINRLFYKSPYQFYRCIEEANKKLDSSHKIRERSISVLKHEKDLTLRVRLSYD